MDDAVLIVIVGALLVEIAYSLWCAWWMRRRYGRRSVPSVLWDSLVRAQARTVVAGLVIAVIGVWSLGRMLADWPPIPAPWGVVGLVAALALLFWGPISDRRTLRRLEGE